MIELTVKDETGAHTVADILKDNGYNASVKSCSPNFIVVVL